MFQPYLFETLSGALKLFCDVETKYILVCLSTGGNSLYWKNSVGRITLHLFNLGHW